MYPAQLQFNPVGGALAPDPPKVRVVGAVVSGMVLGSESAISRSTSCFAVGLEGRDL
jgi:hypothetical protein